MSDESSAIAASLMKRERLVLARMDQANGPWRKMPLTVAKLAARALCADENGRGDYRITPLGRLVAAAMKLKSVK